MANNPNVRSLSRALGAVMLSTTFACGAGIDGAISGTVVEAGSGKPMPGVFVVAQWTHYGSDLVGSRTSCPRLEVVRTDAGGRYSIPAVPTSLLGRTERVIIVFSPGYEWGTPLENPRNAYSIRKYKGDAKTRIDNNETFLGMQLCGPGPNGYTARYRDLFEALDRDEALLSGDPSRIESGRFAKAIKGLELLDSRYHSGSVGGDKK